MPVYDLYSKRKRRAEKAGTAEVYEYDDIPSALRVQIVHIWRDAIGVVSRSTYTQAYSRWEGIHDVMAREKSVFSLSDKVDPDDQCFNWFLGTADTDGALDMIDLTFGYIDRGLGKLLDYQRASEGIKISSEEAIAELNERFKEHGVGYQYENGEIIRVDSQYVHSEVVKPALSLLSGKPFEKAQEDFLAAHRSYREGKHKDSVVAAQRAFESTLKAICTKKKWQFAPGDRAPELLKLVRAQGLFPDYLDKGMDTYIALLKTGLPDVRNSAGGHGEAPEAPAVPGYIAAYALHMTATNVILLVEAMKALK